MFLQLVEEEAENAVESEPRLHTQHLGFVLALATFGANHYFFSVKSIDDNQYGSGFWHIPDLMINQNLRLTSAWLDLKHCYLSATKFPILLLHKYFLYD